MARRYNKSSQSKKKANPGIKSNTNCGCMKSKRKTSMRSKRGNSNKNSKLSMSFGRKQKQLSRKNSRKARRSRRYQSRRQRGGFTDPAPSRECRGPSSIDMNSSDFQSIFTEQAPEPSSLTLDDMYYSFENSEGRQRFAQI